MAKKVVATLRQKDQAKGVTKVIKMVKSETSGAYSFREEIVPNDGIKDFLARK
jgi:hypothetical protein